jgi:site-specific DNA-methyltransferase (adenine-specific)
MKPVTIHGSTFWNCDCISGAADNISDNSVDLIITDPPYGINGDTLHRHYNRNEDFVAKGYVEVPQAQYAEFSLAWIAQAERILRPGGSIYIVSGYTNLVDILSALRRTSLKEINHIIWKYNFGVFTRQKYISSHYHILLYTKPGGKHTFNLESRYGLAEKDANDRSLNNRDREDVWVINREYKPGRLKNKNELPLPLLVKMIQYSSNEGDLVCDLFLGGFSTAKAAIGLNRRATGFEISQPIFNLKVGEMKNVRPGSLNADLRLPLVDNPARSRQPWTDAELQRLRREYRRLAATGIPKKEIVRLLQKTFGRGRFAIEKALQKAGYGRR